MELIRCPTGHSLISSTKGAPWRIAPLLLCTVLYISFFGLRAMADDNEEEEQGGGESSGTTSGRDPTLIGNKVGACFVFFIVAFTGVWVPYFIPIKESAMKLGLSLSGGLFVSLGLGYFIRESGHAFSEVIDDYFEDSYPYSNLVVLLGFMFTWLADLVAQAIWHQKTAQANAAAAQEESKELENGGKVEDAGDKGDLKHAESFGPTIGGAIVESAGKLTILNIIILLMALCFHAIFEGLAVGLTNSVSQVWSKTGSICIAEFFEGLALGTTLRAQDVGRSPLFFFVYACGASLIAPIGLALGIILDSSANETVAEWAEGIGNGLATGVFIFVGTTHLLARAMKPSASDKIWTPFLKWFIAGLGVMIVSLLNLRDG